MIETVCSIPVHLQMALMYFYIYIIKIQFSEILKYNYIWFVNSLITLLTLFIWQNSKEYVFSVFTDLLEFCKYKII